MPLELIDILDTSVKIGLGALISGYATYKVTSLNHKYESSESRRNKKIAVIESISLDFDTYYQAVFNAVNAALSTSRTFPQITDLSDDSDPDTKYSYEYLSDEFQKTQETCVVHTSIVSRLELLQLLESKECVLRLADFYDDLRLQFLREQTMLNEAEILDLLADMSEIKNDFYKIMCKHYDI